MWSSAGCTLNSPPPSFPHPQVSTSSLTSIGEVVPAIRVLVSSRDRDRRAPIAELVLCSSESVLRSMPDEGVGHCVWLPLVLARGGAAVRDAVVRVRWWGLDG